MLVVLLCILLLILLNALYVAAEFATVSVRQARVLALAEAGHSQAKLFIKVLQNPQYFDQYIAACQVGITLSSLILGAYGQQALAPVLNRILPPQMAEYGTATLILIFLTVLQMILGEILPKSLALRFPTPLALYTIWPMRLSLWLLAWPLVLLNGSGNFILKRLGLLHDSHKHVNSSAEIDYLLRESQNQGVLEQGISWRLRKALHLGERSVREVMIPRQEIQTLDLNLPPAALLAVLLKTPFARLPVWRETADQVLGSISVKRCVAIFAREGQFPGLDGLVEPLLALPKELSIERALLKLRQHKVAMALIVDEHGGVSGLLTLQDILAELTGHLNDEFKPERQWCERLEDGQLQISGRMRLSELKEAWGLDWPSDQSTTVNGFLLEQFKTLPAKGDVWEDLQGQVVIAEMSTSGHSILTVLFQPRRQPLPGLEGTDV